MVIVEEKCEKSSRSFDLDKDTSRWTYRSQAAAAAQNWEDQTYLKGYRTNYDKRPAPKNILQLYTERVEDIHHKFNFIWRVTFNLQL
jgi:hypothetical protein